MTRRKGMLAGGIVLIVVGAILLPIGVVGYFVITVRNTEVPCGVPDATGQTRICGTGESAVMWLIYGIVGAAILGGGIVIIAKSNKRAEPVRSQ